VEDGMGGLHPKTDVLQAHLAQVSLTPHVIG
jgi:hypothetical protein